MSALGQKQTFAVRKAMSALPPIATAKADSRKRSCPLYPQKRTCAVQLGMSALGQKRTSCLLDHLVSSCEQGRGHSETKGLGGFEVYNEFKLGRLHDRHVSRPFALENPASVDTGLPPSIKIVRSIANKTADSHGLEQGVNRWHGRAGRPRGAFGGGWQKRHR